jgi:hypothetical protein
MTKQTTLTEPAMTFDAIGAHIGTSGEEARRIHERAMDKLFFILALRWGYLPLDWEPSEGQ